MKTVSIEYKVYTFNELSEKAKQKAIQDQQKFEQEILNLDYVIEDEEAKLNELGYKDIKIFYSGFYSQGDGASFEAVITDQVLKRVLDENKDKFPILSKERHQYLLDFINVTIIRTNFHYYHENSRSINLEYNLYGLDKRINNLDSLNSEILRLEDCLEAERKELSKAIYKSLKEAYESILEEENIINNIIANEYLFLETGELFTESN